MKSSDVIDWVGNTLGMTRSGKISSPTAVLLARLPACVLCVQDEHLAGYLPKTITTVAGVGEYTLAAGVDAVLRRVWPSEWLDIMPSVTGTHSYGSDITSEQPRLSGGPKYAEPIELADFQSRATAHNTSLEYPVMWSTWHDENRQLIFAVAPAEAVAADLEIVLQLRLSKAAAWSYDETIPVDDHYLQLLQYMLAVEGAAYAQGEMIAASDYAAAQFYAGREQWYSNEVRKETARLRQTHHPTTQRAEVNTLNHHWFPKNND